MQQLKRALGVGSGLTAERTTRLFTCLASANLLQPTANATGLTSRHAGKAYRLLVSPLTLVQVNLTTLQLLPLAQPAPIHPAFIRREGGSPRLADLFRCVTDRVSGWR